MNKMAVAMAADSRATLRTSDGGTKTHDTVNKLFTLSKYHPVGVMIYGNAEFMAHPWETIIKIYRDRLRERSFRRLNEYADDFISSLLIDYQFDENMQKSNVFSIFIDFFTNIFEAAVGLQDHDDELDWAPAVDYATDILAKRTNDAEDIGVFGRMTASDMRKLYSEQAHAAFLRVFDEQLPPVQRRKIIRHGFASLMKKVFSDGHSGLVVAGFGDSEEFPSFKMFELDGVVAGRLRVAQSSTDINLSRTVSLRPFAQREMVDRFMVGIDPRYALYLRGAITRICNEIAAEVIQKFGAGNSAAKARHIAAVAPIVNQALDDHFDQAQRWRKEKFSDPIVEMTQSLPIGELAHLAESLVNLTSLKRRVSLDTESVGGPIDVAVISKGDGFIWIKRKHYFGRDLNPTFMDNYFRTHINARGETAHERQKRKASRRRRS
jgi:hypothetical protein